MLVWPAQNWVTSFGTEVKKKKKAQKFWVWTAFLTARMWLNEWLRLLSTIQRATEIWEGKWNTLYSFPVPAFLLFSLSIDFTDLASCGWKDGRTNVDRSVHEWVVCRSVIGQVCHVRLWAGTRWVCIARVSLSRRPRGTDDNQELIFSCKELFAC